MHLQQQHQSSQPITIGSQTTIPTYQSIIIHDGTPTIFPTNFICFIPCALIIALNGLTVLTGIPPTKFYAAPPIISPAIYVVYGINLLLIAVLLPTHIPIVVPPPASQFLYMSKVFMIFINDVLVQVHQLIIQYILYFHV